MMPGVTGYEMLKEIRTNLNDKSTPIIVATSKSGAKDIRDCLSLGIVGYVVKPFDPDTIALKILEYYEKADKERASAARDLHEKTIAQWQKMWHKKRGET
jgi:CheY-like chemotaxis protein